MPRCHSHEGWGNLSTTQNIPKCVWWRDEKGLTCDKHTTPHGIVVIIILSYHPPRWAINAAVSPSHTAEGVDLNETFIKCCLGIRTTIKL